MGLRWSCLRQPKRVSRNTHIAYRALIIPAGADAPMTPCRRAKQRRPGRMPSVSPIPGIKPAQVQRHRPDKDRLTQMIHFPLVRHQTSLRLSSAHRLANDAQAPLPELGDFAAACRTVLGERRLRTGVALDSNSESFRIRIADPGRCRKDRNDRKRCRRYGRRGFTPSRQTQFFPGAPL